jgi:hypothetical protein
MNSSYTQTELVCEKCMMIEIDYQRITTIQQLKPQQFEYKPKLYDGQDLKTYKI